MSSKFNTFYKNYVVLPQEKLDELYSKKDLNLQRLKEGLKEYNLENDTNYKIIEDCVQGSVDMATVVQNEDNDFDIDVAVVFDKDDLEGKGPLAIRNIIADALKRKTKQLNADPEVKTSCVRIKYADGYHVDFAVYRRSWDDYNCKWKYEHAGENWSERDLKGLSKWFIIENDSSDKNLRKLVRLSKMFCNSRDDWKYMPSGLLQTVVCSESLQLHYSRIDELFYYSMQEVVNRLERNSSVFAPVDNNRDLTPRQIDIKKMINWKNRLKSKLEDLDILFKDECTQENALQAWCGFFNHDYWYEQASKNTNDIRANTNLSITRHFYDGEQFIEDLYPVNYIYSCKFSCKLSGNGLNSIDLTEYLKKWRWYVPHNLTVRCELIYTDCPKDYKTLWKVKNVGPIAEKLNKVRGQIYDRGKSIEEPTSFFGNHYIECYIIKNGVCVAKQRTDIPIGWS